MYSVQPFTPLLQADDALGANTLPLTFTVGGNRRYNTNDGLHNTSYDRFVAGRTLDIPQLPLLVCAITIVLEAP